MKSFPALRISVIAAALMLAIPVAHAGTTATSSAAKYVAVTDANQTYDGFIVTYRVGTSERGSSGAVVQNVQAAASRASLHLVGTTSTGGKTAPLSVVYQRKLAVGSDLVNVSRALSRAEANALMLQLAADPAVAYVEPNTVMRAVRDFRASSPTSPLAAPRAVTPNDPLYGRYQWNFFNAIGGANINNAWDLADGTGVTVAVLDTGITEHPDLDTSLANAGYDFLSSAFYSGRDADGRASGGWDLGDWTTEEPWLSQCVSASNPAANSSWHGTNVSGVIAERTDNGEGYAGIAHNAKLLPVRVLGHCGGPTSDIADAIVWAAGGHVDGVPDNTHPAQVINMSLGGGGSCSASSAFGQAIAFANSKGVAVVAAAGNSNADASQFSPASCPGAIAVASNGVTGKRAFYSNYGATVVLSAPGGGVCVNDDPATGQQADPDGFVWAALNDGEKGPSAPAYGPGYAGTSQATPHVAGTIALMLDAMKAAGMEAPNPAEIRNILVRSAKPFPVTQDHPVGAGILDAYAAVNLALGNDDGGGDEQATPLAKGVILSGQAGAPGSSALYSITVPAGATMLNIRTMGGSGDVSLYVKTGSAPNADGSDADFTSARPGNNDALVLATPQAATYYIRVAAGASPYANVSVLADYRP
jgi:serine protease